jgi:hypothetical protein
MHHTTFFLDARLHVGNFPRFGFGSFFVVVVVVAVVLLLLLSLCCCCYICPLPSLTGRLRQNPVPCWYPLQVGHCPSFGSFGHLFWCLGTKFAIFFVVIVVVAAVGLSLLLLSLMFRCCNFFSLTVLDGRLRQSPVLCWCVRDQYVTNS